MGFQAQIKPKTPLCQVAIEILPLLVHLFNFPGEFLHNDPAFELQGWGKFTVGAIGFHRLPHMRQQGEFFHLFDVAKIRVYPFEQHVKPMDDLRVFNGLIQTVPGNVVLVAPAF